MNIAIFTNIMFIEHQIVQTDCPPPLTTVCVCLFPGYCLCDAECGLKLQLFVATVEMSAWDTQHSPQPSQLQQWKCQPETHNTAHSPQPSQLQPEHFNTNSDTQKYQTVVRFEVTTAVLLKIQVSLNVTPCRLVNTSICRRLDESSISIFRVEWWILKAEAELEIFTVIDEDLRLS
jgi:hypothetical protein